MKLINYLYPQIEEENKITCLQNKIIVGLPSNIYFISLAYGYWQVFPWFLYQFFKKAALELLDWESRILTCILISILIIIKIFHQRKTKIFSFLVTKLKKPIWIPCFMTCRKTKLPHQATVSWLVNVAKGRKLLLKKVAKVLKNVITGMTMSVLIRKLVSQLFQCSWILVS